MKFIYFFFSLSNVIFAPAGTVRRVTLGVVARGEGWKVRIRSSRRSCRDNGVLPAARANSKRILRGGGDGEGEPTDAECPRVVATRPRLVPLSAGRGRSIAYATRANGCAFVRCVCFVDPRVPVACAHFRVYTRASRCGAVQRDWYSARKKLACTPFLRVVTWSRKIRAGRFGD